MGGGSTKKITLFSMCSVVNVHRKLLGWLLAEAAILVFDHVNKP